MEYRVTFYRTEDGAKPVAELLEALKGKNDALHKLVTAGLRKLKHRDNHGPPLTAPVRGSLGIMELRVGHTNIARVFFFFRPGKDLVRTNGYVKKSQKLDPDETSRAERHKVDWELRFP